jgi:hypothetical protein
MRIWDIIDRVEPGLEITEVNERAVKLAPAGVKFTLTVATGLILAAAGTFCIDIPVPDRTATIVSGGNRKPAKSASTGTELRADTPHAMSGPKLARAFAALFEPTEDEPELEGSYFFG